MKLKDILKNRKHGTHIFGMGILLAALCGLSAVLTPVFKTKGEEETSEKEALEILNSFPKNGGKDVFLMSGIELTFNSESVDTGALLSAVTIEPEVPFFVTSGEDSRTLVLYPEKEMEPDTLYHVTVKKGLSDEEGRVLQEDLSFSFSTGKEELQTYYEGITLTGAGSGTAVNALTDEIPTFFAVVNQELAKDFTGGTPQAQVTLSRFEDTASYRKALLYTVNERYRGRNGKPSDPSEGEGTVPVTGFTLTGEKYEGDDFYWWGSSEYVFSLPEPLEEGAYLAQFDFLFTTKHGDITVTQYALIQSTPLSVFCMNTENSMLAWIHDAETSEPLSGASVRYYGSDKQEKAGVTDEEGKIFLEGVEKKKETDKSLKALLELCPYNYNVIEAEKDGRTFIDVLSNDVLYLGYFNNWYTDTGKEYYTYIYTDRAIYKTTDEVAFFGVIRPRKTSAQIPAELTVKLESGYWRDESVAELTVTPDEKGFFAGKISFEDQKDLYYARLVAVSKEKGEIVSSAGFSVQDFEKPVYTYSVSLDKPVYVLGKDRDEAAVLSIDVSYFDGTPAGFYQMQKEWNYGGVLVDENELTADEKGHMETSVAFQPASFEDTWYPQTASVSYRSKEAEDEILYVSEEIPVIARDVMLLAEYDRENQEFLFSTYDVNTDKIESRADLYNTDKLKGEALSQSVEARIYRCWYEKISEGMAYDYVYKRTYEKFTYEYHEDLYDTVTVETADGEGRLSYEVPDDDASYYAEISTKDHADRNVRTRVYLNLRVFNYEYYREDTFALRLENGKTEEVREMNGYCWLSSENTFSEAEPAVFTLTKNGEEFEIPEGGSLLSYAIGDQVTEISIGTENGKQVAFSEDLLPNYIVSGAYFDGKNAWPLSVTGMSFDYETRKLSLAVEKDQETYEPGTEASVRVTALRPSGEPVPAGTAIVLSVVDEAVFALSDQQIMALEALYRTHGIDYNSYTSKNNTNIAENSRSKSDEMVEEAAEADGVADNGVGGTAEHIRSEFKDSAYFELASADETGSAVFDFTVPDNMTSWRLSVISVTEDVYAGSQTEALVCTKPYYTVPVLNDVMIEGDTFSIGLRSAGTSDNTQPCQYEVSILSPESGEVLYTAETSAPSFREIAYAQIEGLTAGSYKVLIRGTSGEYTDLSEYPFTVLLSGLEAYASRSGLLTDILDIHPLRYPVELSIYDKEAASYYQVLTSLLFSRDIRSDERLGEYYAMKVLSENGQLYWKERLKEADISDLRYIFPLFTYGKENAEISALSYLAVPEILETGLFYGITPEDIGQSMESPYEGSPYAAYLIQAILEYADPEEILSVLQEEEISFRERVYLETALYLSGRTEEAERFYTEEILPHYETAEAVSGEVIGFVNIDEKTTVQNDTAAALILSSLLKKDEAESMALYLTYKSSDKNIYPMEKILYLKSCERTGDETCTVSYFLNGETHTEELGSFGRLGLTLQKAELEALNLQVISGEPEGTVFYICGAEELTDESAKKLEVSVSLDKDTYAAGDEAAITVTPSIGSLDPSFGSSTMLLDVYIPSGMRFERYTPDTNDWRHWYLESRDGQRLRFVLYDASEERTGDFSPVTFYASCVTTGTYVVEKAYLSSLYYDTFGLSERAAVRIE